MPFIRVGWLALVTGYALLILGSDGALAANPPNSEECLLCHGSPELPEPLYIEEAVFKESVHGSLACVGCHKGATAPHDELPALKETQTCAVCHWQAVGDYQGSIHGRSREGGRMEAATCSSCHGNPHAILNQANLQSPTYHLNLPRTCARCHADPELARRYNIPA